MAPHPPPLPMAQNVLNFFLEIFGKIIGWRPLLEGWHPLSTEYRQHASGTHPTRMLSCFLSDIRSTFHNQLFYLFPVCFTTIVEKLRNAMCFKSSRFGLSLYNNQHGVTEIHLKLINIFPQEIPEFRISINFLNIFASVCF